MPIRRRGRMPPYLARVREWQRLYEERMWSLQSIADEFSEPVSRVRKALLELGVTLRKQGSRSRRVTHAMAEVTLRKEVRELREEVERLKVEVAWITSHASRK